MVLLQTMLFTLFSNREVQSTQEIILNQGFSFESFIRGIIGMCVLILIAYIFSKDRKAINWKTTIIGLVTQLVLAIAVLKVVFVQRIFEFFGKIFIKTLDFTLEGSKFLLGDMVNIESFGYVFLFQVLPTIIFFSALTSVLFYLGIIQKVVRGLAWLLSKLLKISGAESLSVAGNIFLGQTEAPLMIKAYLEKMSKSEILLVMIGGMATVAGGVLAAYISFLGGDDEVSRLFYAKHLLTASVMAAPGAIVISKILYPQKKSINQDFNVSQDKIGSFSNINTWIDENTPYKLLSLEFVLGYIFSPLMWIIGVAKEDMALMGQLLGIKLAASEFIGYMQLGELKNVANLIHLNYEKSIIMATYMLCGFANFASIGIQIGGIGSLAPNQRENLSKFGFLAVVGGTLASLLSATIAGMIIG